MFAGSMSLANTTTWGQTARRNEVRPSFPKRAGISSMTRGERGQLVDFLDRRGLAAKTAVVYITDIG